MLSGELFAAVDAVNYFVITAIDYISGLYIVLYDLIAGSVTFCFEHSVGFGDLVFTICIGEIFVVCLIVPVADISALGAGSCYGFNVRQSKLRYNYYLEQVW